MPFLIRILLRLGVPERFAGLAAKMVIGAAAMLLLIGLWLGGVWGFHLIQHSDNDAVRAAVDASWQERVAAGEREARLREATLTGIIQSNAEAFGRRLADKIAAGTVLIGQVKDEVAKNRVVYGGCVEPPELRASTRDLVRSIDDPADYRDGDGSVLPDAHLH